MGPTGAPASGPIVHTTVPFVEVVDQFVVEARRQRRPVRGRVIQPIEDQNLVRFDGLAKRPAARALSDPQVELRVVAVNRYSGSFSPPEKQRLHMASMSANSRAAWHSSA